MCATLEDCHVHPGRKCNVAVKRLHCRCKAGFIRRPVCIDWNPGHLIAEGNIQPKEAHRAALPLTTQCWQCSLAALTCRPNPGQSEQQLADLLAMPLTVLMYNSCSCGSQAAALSLQRFVKNSGSFTMGAITWGCWMRWLQAVACTAGAMQRQCAPSGMGSGTQARGQAPALGGGRHQGYKTNYISGFPTVEAAYWNRLVVAHLGNPSR
jgi:hypothetical protein